jgi:hypothetical protein
VYLGYAGEDENSVTFTDDDLAFVGIVDEVSQNFKSVSITAFSMAYKIILKKADSKEFDQPEEKKKKKSSKEIITTLLSGLLDIDSTHFKDGLSFTGYTPNTDKTIYDNIKELADLNGLNFYISKNGKARFDEGSSGSPHEFKYGTDILDCDVTMSKPPFDSVEIELVYQPGEQSKSLKYETTGGSTTANEKKHEVKEINLGLPMDQTTAKQITKNILKQAYKPETGHVKVIGNTKVDLGDKVSILFPDPAPGAKELHFMERTDVTITNITHKFGRKSGFVTTIGWEKEYNGNSLIKPSLPSKPHP